MVTATPVANPRHGRAAASSYARPDRSNWQAVRPESDGRVAVPAHRAPRPRSASACSQDAPELPSTAAGRHQQQPVILKLARALNPRAAHGNTLVMRSSVSCGSCIVVLLRQVSLPATPADLAGLTARARPKARPETRAADLRAAPAGMTGQTEASTPSPIITCGQITRPKRGGGDLFEHPARRYTARRGAAGRRRRDGLD